MEFSKQVSKALLLNWPQIDHIHLLLMESHYNKAVPTAPPFFRKVCYADVKELR